MFRNIIGTEHESGRKSAASLTVNENTSPGLDSQESSWIGLLSVVSRPAMSFLQKYLPGRARNPVAQSDKAVGWIRGDMKKTFVEEENEFLSQFDDMIPAPHLTYLQCQHQSAATNGGVPWLTTESLREMGIQDPEEVNLNLGCISSARTVFNHVMLSSVSSQEMKGVKAGSKSRPWWGSLWGGEEEIPQGKPLSYLSWTVTGMLCPQRPGSETKASAVFVQEEREWTVGENAGPASHKEEPANNGGLHTVQNPEKSTADHHLSITDHLSLSEAAACLEVTLLTPDQDNGYSSLEEEQVQIGQQHMMTASAPINRQSQMEAAIASTESSCTTGTDMAEEESPEEEEETPEEEEEEEEVVVNEKEEMQKDDDEAQELPSAVAIVTPKCQNPTIAFIMGCPCSDDDSSQSESSDDDFDDDDGFDSEGLSDLSNSSDDEDSETERLWNSLCHNHDPYNLRNFTARLHTGPPTLPRTIPSAAAASATPPSSSSSSPASPPTLPAPSPPSGSDTWDDSASASEADEGESLKLWSSFSCSSDPYSPLNFQASLRTQSSKTRAKKATQTPLQNPASPPKYRKKAAEERHDSGFSELSTSTSSRSTKKVRFCDDVEEFFASCSEEEEDRRGPWEELARDRCRFLKRCQEVEQSIAFCLQPQHRSKVYRRLQQRPDQHA